jgi:alpha-beta hydrolase superfamily lysophospholipase
MKQFTLEDYQKNKIHIYQYEPEGEIKGVVQIVHGASEHFARYGIFSEFLNKQGYLVLGCDIIGHGLSTDNYDFVHFADKNGDLLAYESVLLIKEYIEKNYPNQEYFLIGHSMGSFIARKLVLDFPDFYKKVVISGTAHPPKAIINIGIALTKIIKFFKGPKYVSQLIQNMGIDANHKKMRKDKIISGINEEWLTRDELIQQYYQKSNMCGQPFTVSANLDMFKWLKFVNDKQAIKSGKLTLPHLFISGGHDPLSDYGKQIVKLVDKMKEYGYENISMKIYPEARHEVLNEINKDEVFNDILKFLNT